MKSGENDLIQAEIPIYSSSRLGTNNANKLIHKGNFPAQLLLHTDLKLIVTLQT